MAKNNKKHENIFRKLARWFVRVFMGLKYEEKWFPRDNGGNDSEKKPDDSEFIVSPGRQAFNSYMERKFAVVAFIVVAIMFLIVFIVPNFMPKYRMPTRRLRLKTFLRT